MNDYTMKMKLLESYISRWSSKREGECVSELFSETDNFLRYCLEDLVSAQKIESCIKDCDVGFICTIDGRMPPAEKVIKEGSREVICKILQGVKDAIAVPHL